MDPLDHVATKLLVGDGCWLWTGTLRNGYGRFSHGTGKFITAHRFVYELLVGPIPTGMVLDHLCRERACCRPDHLRVVTSRENTLALGSEALAARERDKTHCPQGHEYDEANTKLYQGRRYCRACIRLDSAKRRDRKRGGPPRPYNRKGR